MSSLFLPFRLFTKSAIVRWLLFSIIAANVVSWGLILLEIPRQATINLHYTVYFGIDRIGPWWHAFVFPLVGFCIAVVDFFTAWLFAKKFSLLGNLLLVSGLLAELLLLGQSIIVVVLNS